MKRRGFIAALLALMSAACALPNIRPRRATPVNRMRPPLIDFVDNADPDIHEGNRQGLRALSLGEACNVRCFVGLPGPRIYPAHLVRMDIAPGLYESYDLLTEHGTITVMIKA